MKIKILLPVLLIALCACENDTQTESPANTATLHATMAQRVESRATMDLVNGTRTAFESGDQIGLYASKYLRQNNLLETAVENVMFELIGSKWEGDTPKLKWNTTAEGGDTELSADIYAYYPYQADLTGGYTIFKGAATAGVLDDILMAERTQVENNNPAIFLTFKHRFALLQLTLGTGMAGVGENDIIAAVMDQGMAEKATINMNYVNDRENDVIKLQAGTIKEFNPTKRGENYYIILPCGDFDGPGELDSIAFTHIRIQDEYSELAKAIKPQPNTLYKLTVHKGSEGSIDIQLGEIEIWQNSNDIGSVREQSGIYSAGDLRNLIIAYNANPGKDNTTLKSYGIWDDAAQCWEFKLLRNIDMKDLAAANRKESFTSFLGIFDGGGYTITGLDITGDGFFGNIQSGSEVKNLTLTDIAVNSTSGNSSGALAGTVASGVTIHNIKVNGVSTVTGSGGNTGGLIGQANSTITRCSATVEVTNTSGSNAGGLVGNLGASGTIDNSFASGRVTSAGSNTGGLVGNAEGTITNSYAACKVSGKDQTGGLVGTTTADVTNCYAIGTIEGQNKVGGLVGSTTATVTRCTADGTVSGQTSVGGLIGYTSTKVNDSSARATVAGTANVGGLVGETVTYQPYVPYQPEIPEIPEIPAIPGTPEIPADPDADPPVEYQPEVPETPAVPGVPGVPEQPEIPESGTLITASYATNGTSLVATGGAKIVDSYDIGNNVTGDENNYFSIPLTATAAEINDILNTLNSTGTAKWILGKVLINGQAYDLPVLAN